MATTVSKSAPNGENYKVSQLFIGQPRTQMWKFELMTCWLEIQIYGQNMLLIWEPNLRQLLDIKTGLTILIALIVREFKQQPFADGLFNELFIHFKFDKVSI